VRSMRLVDVESTQPEVGPGSHALDPGYVAKSMRPRRRTPPLGAR